MNRVLIVDDEPSICWALTELLAEEGYSTTAVGSAEEALQLSHDDELRLVLLDVRLPGLDGISAMPLLRERFGRVPIVVMTAFGDLETAVRAVDSGAADYITKPLNADDRSEEHTSELQSQSNLVCRLLLEKKKQKKKQSKPPHCTPSPEPPGLPPAPTHGCRSAWVQYSPLPWCSTGAAERTLGGWRQWTWS